MVEHTIKFEQENISIAIMLEMEMTGKLVQVSTLKYQKGDKLKCQLP